MKTGIIKPPLISGNAIRIGRTLTGQSFTVTAIPKLIIKSTYAWPYLLLNPQRNDGIAESAVATGIVSADTVVTFPYSVLSYKDCHLFLTITAITGTWDLELKAYDDATLAYFSVQTLFSGMTATTDGGYAYLGPRGIGSYVAFNFNNIAAGSLTYTLALLLKGGIGPGLSGNASIIYIGGPEVSSNTGFPLLPGISQEYYLEENVEIWAVSAVSTGLNMRVFYL